MNQENLKVKQYQNVFQQAQQHPMAEEFYQEAIGKIREEELEKINQQNFFEDSFEQEDNELGFITIGDYHFNSSVSGNTIENLRLVVEH